MTGQLIGLIASWLILAAVAGWCLPQRWQLHGISACGIGLLAMVAPVMLLFLGVAIPASIAVAASARRGAWTPWFVAGIAVIHGGFLILASWSGMLALGQLVVPFARAYATLRLIHYVVEAARGTLPRHRWPDAVHYQLFAPVLAVGPINRFAPFQRQLRERKWDAQLVSAGLSRILVGAVKIVVLGNYLVSNVLDVRISHLGPLGEWYGQQLQFWVSLYVQFSGYTDVAIGVAAVLGFRMPENFNYPYLARNIGDFWRRWHITLADWCRDYVYMPVFARRRSAGVATLASMVTLGLWHQASVHYLLWGGYHAAGLTLWRSFQGWTRAWYDRGSIGLQRGWDWLAWLLTIHFVVMSYTVTTWIERMMAGR